MGVTVLVPGAAGSSRLGPVCGVQFGSWPVAVDAVGGLYTVLYSECMLQLRWAYCRSKSANLSFKLLISLYCIFCRAQSW